jgi:hypothetical protein
VTPVLGIKVPSFQIRIGKVSLETSNSKKAGSIFPGFHWFTQEILRGTLPYEAKNLGLQYKTQAVPTTMYRKVE